MYQPWIFGAMMAAGSGLVAFTVKIQSPALPSIAPESPPAAVHVVPPPAPTPVAEPVTTNAFVELPPVVIEGTRHRPAVRSVATPAEPVVAERPCSSWREIGPTHVVSGKPTGNSSVRELCQ